MSEVSSTTNQEDSTLSSQKEGKESEPMSSKNNGQVDVPENNKNDVDSPLSMKFVQLFMLVTGLISIIVLFVIHGGGTWWAILPFLFMLYSLVLPEMLSLTSRRSSPEDLQLKKERDAILAELNKLKKEKEEIPEEKLLQRKWANDIGLGLVVLDSSDLKEERRKYNVWYHICMVCMALCVVGIISIIYNNYKSVTYEYKYCGIYTDTKDSSQYVVFSDSLMIGKNSAIIHSAIIEDRDSLEVNRKIVESENTKIGSNFKTDRYLDAFFKISPIFIMLTILFVLMNQAARTRKKTEIISTKIQEYEYIKILLRAYPIVSDKIDYDWIKTRITTMVDNHLEAQRKRLDGDEKVDVEEDVVSTTVKDVSSTFSEISKSASEAFKSINGKK